MDTIFKLIFDFWFFCVLLNQHNANQLTICSQLKLSVFLIITKIFLFEGMQHCASKTSILRTAFASQNLYFFSQAF